jgi:hypothetical protein
LSSVLGLTVSSDVFLSFFPFLPFFFFFDMRGPFPVVEPSR